jgi:C4-type Zn-finger protein
MDSEKLAYSVEGVARAIHEAHQQACSWSNEPDEAKERFREYARNAIELLNDDIGVLLAALAGTTAEQRVR